MSTLNHRSVTDTTTMADDQVNGLTPMTDSPVDTNEQASYTASLKGTVAGVMAGISSVFTPAVTTVAVPVAVTLTATSCETNAPGKDIEKTNPNALTAEQQAFANLLAPHADGTLKYSVLEGGVDPYIFTNFAKVNLKLLDAKAMRYEATPMLQKKSIADVIAKAKELNPGQSVYGITLSLVKKAGGSETVLNTTEEISDIDDNNPSTKAPWLAVLPDEFTLDEFKKYSPNSTMTKSYNLNAGEELIVRIYVAGSQSIFTNFNFGVNPLNSVN